jgi:hypothetical protein
MLEVAAVVLFVSDQVRLITARWWAAGAMVAAVVDIFVTELHHHHCALAVVAQQERAAVVVVRVEIFSMEAVAQVQPLLVALEAPELLLFDIPKQIRKQFSHQETPLTQFLVDSESIHLHHLAQLFGNQEKKWHTLHKSIRTIK